MRDARKRAPWPSFERRQALLLCWPLAGIGSVAALIETLLRGRQLTDTMANKAQTPILRKCLITGRLVGYSSGQRGQTVNLLAYAYEGSNPSPTTTFMMVRRQLNKLHGLHRCKGEQRVLTQATEVTILELRQQPGKLAPA